MLKLYLMQAGSVVLIFYGRSLLGDDYNTLGYVILMIGVPVAIFSTPILAYRIFSGSFLSEKDN